MKFGVKSQFNERGLASLVRQLFRANDARDSLAVQFFWGDLSELIQFILKRHLDEDLRWDPEKRVRSNQDHDDRDWWLDGLDCEQMFVTPFQYLYFRGSVYVWGDCPENNKLEFVLEICPFSGRIRHFEAAFMLKPNSEENWRFHFEKGTGRSIGDLLTTERANLIELEIVYRDSSEYDENVLVYFERILALMTRQVIRAHRADDSEAIVWTLNRFEFFLCAAIRHLILNHCRDKSVVLNRVSLNETGSPYSLETSDNGIRFETDVIVYLSTPNRVVNSLEHLCFEIELCPDTHEFIRSVTNLGTGEWLRSAFPDDDFDPKSGSAGDRSWNGVFFRTR